MAANFITDRLWEERKPSPPLPLSFPPAAGRAIAKAEEMQKLTLKLVERAMRAECLDDDTIEHILRRVLLGNKAEHATNQEGQNT